MHHFLKNPFLLAIGLASVAWLFLATIVVLGAPFANQAARWLRLAGVRLSSQSPHPTDRRDTLASDDAYAARADELLRRRNPPAPTGGGEGHGSPRDRARKARRATDRHVQILDVSPVA